jgi:hypothetical protein
MRLQMRWFRIVSGRLLPPQNYLRPYLKREMAKAVEWLTCAVTAGVSSNLAEKSPIHNDSDQGG